MIARLPGWRRRVALALLATAVLASIGSCAFSGPRHLDRYPPRESSPYVLPFRGARFVCQGNNGAASHHGWQEFAYDFYMPEDTPVYAARGGVVIEAHDGEDSIGTDAPANYIKIAHDDGTVSWYYHLRKGGVLVWPRAAVPQGKLIARSGWTGIALIPHLHFQVTRGIDGDTIPVTFRDVPGDGIPRAPGWVGKD